MNKNAKIHMKTEEFRKQGYKVIDWIADYYEHIEEYPVLSQVEPGKIRSQLPDNAPIEGRGSVEPSGSVRRVYLRLRRVPHQ